jgi:hypothetical protein
MSIQHYPPRLAHSKAVSNVNSDPLSTYAPKLSIIPIKSNQHTAKITVKSDITINYHHFKFFIKVRIIKVLAALIPAHNQKLLPFYTCA